MISGRVIHLIDVSGVWNGGRHTVLIGFRLNHRKSRRAGGMISHWRVWYTRFKCRSYVYDTQEAMQMYVGLAI